ncbi:hypothetical protein [Hydrogenophaga sp.]|uniref:hypothetical protein n=1 Tax=Hydrogenophaga sp. TaxID=1904254 RepID=UPI0025C6E763|nr:hypothetical protein [Hydrogenophaga sp.]
MAKPRPAHPVASSSSHALPDPETLRRSALQASWRRDRWVRARRLAWRWLLWACWRYGPAALLLLAALGALGRWLL